MPPSVAREGRRRPWPPSLSLLRIALALLGVDPSWLPPPLRPEPPLGRRRSAVLDLCFLFDIYPPGGQEELVLFHWSFASSPNRMKVVRHTRTHSTTQKRVCWKTKTAKATCSHGHTATACRLSMKSCEVYSSEASDEDKTKWEQKQLTEYPSLSNRRCSSLCKLFMLSRFVASSWAAM